MKRIPIKILSLLFLFFPSSIYAETIVLKSGKTMEGKITQKIDNRIKIDVGGMLMGYYLDEIETINGKRVEVYNPDVNAQEEKRDNKFASQEASDQGVAYLDRQRYDEAIAEFNKAIEIDPSFADAYYNRGIANSKKGNLDQAISDYTKAIQINPKDSDFYYNRGLAYHKKNDFDQAISDYTKTIQISPDAAAYYNRALDYSLKKEYDYAWDDVHKAEALGYKVNASFLEELKKASGRQD
jgi:tetratricopeptide (TPR) repeat protein